MKEKILKRILKFVKAKGLTLHQLAVASKIDPKTVYKWFNKDNAAPSFDSICKICGALDIPLIMLISTDNSVVLDDKSKKILDLYAALGSHDKVLFEKLLLRISK